MDFNDKKWQDGMRVTVDYNYMMSKSLGDKGIKDSEISALSEKAASAYGYVAKTAVKTNCLWVGRSFLITRMKLWKIF